MHDGLDKEQREQLDETLMEAPEGVVTDGRPIWARGDDDMEMDIATLQAGIR